MGYTFPQVPYKVYTKTFLKDVHIIFKYSMVHPTDTILANTKHFYEEDFNVTTQDVDVAEGVYIKTKDDSLRFDFKWDSLTICMKSPLYKSIDLTIEVLRYALKFFKIIGVNTIEKLVFYKYNELAYNTTKEIPVSKFMGEIFSKDLLDNMTSEDIKAQVELSRWEKQIDFDDKYSKFTIEFGFSRSDKESNTGSLALKTQIETENYTFPVDDIINTIKEYNQVLDNAFHWSVTKKIVKEME